MSGFTPSVLLLVFGATLASVLLVQIYRAVRDVVANVLADTRDQ